MNKVINWFCGSFIRTIGRFLAFVVIGMLVATLLQQSNIKITDLLGIQRVHADTFSPGSWTNGIIYYKNSAKTQVHDTLANSGGTTYYAVVQSSTSQYTWYTATDFYFNNSFDLSSKSGGHIDFQLNVGLPRILRNNPNTIYTHYCTNWSPEAPTGNVAYSCSYIDQDSNTINDSEYVIPKTSFKALLYYGSGYVDCTFNSNTNVISCPILSWATSVNRLTIQSYVQYSTSSSYDYYLELGNVPAVYVSDSKDITTNQNQNTQQVINNQNQNTNATIENQNQNTQQQIESQNVCSKIDKLNIKEDKKYLDNNGNLAYSPYYGVTDFINIEKSTIKVIAQYNYSLDTMHACFYNVNKVLISCTPIKDLSGTLTIPNNSTYFRSSIFVDGNVPTYEICQNGNQALANTLTDSNTAEASGEADSFFSGFSVSDNGGLSGIITAPLSAIQSITSSSCSPLVLPLPFINKNLTLPCMRQIYLDNFGGFMTLYDIITLGIISYWIIVRIFNLVKDFKNPEHDEIEVVDL